jgi:hypothetical protein
MWLFINEAFLSIANKSDDSNMLLVRARRTIERLLPEANVHVGGGTDYCYRSRIDRERMATVIADSIRKIDYSNFKSTVTDAHSHNSYMDACSAMFAFQDEV